MGEELHMTAMQLVHLYAHVSVGVRSGGYIAKLKKVSPFLNLDASCTYSY